MPIGIQRINSPRPQPSSQVIFIKPLPGPTSAYAQDFLERIAAICHPIMKANHLSIMTLEEHEPNPEFIGRNFNAGEIIQLVLKAPYSGHWLSFRSVQMVMMHELAHCVQMNHSGAFWKVNNRFKGELRELWAKGYTGDGLWGRGRTLLSEEYHTGRNLENEIMPANLCGGSFRSSRRGKRKRAREKPKESYAERQQRRIKKKFGVNGVTLGDDHDTKVKLENGMKAKGKPRVAGSKRGRELRAAAALARFDQVKKESPKDENLFSESETESDEDNAGGAEVFNPDGSRLRDGKGRGMVKVCEDADRDDVHVKQEIQELQSLNSAHPNTQIGETTNVDMSGTPVTDNGEVSLNRLSRTKGAATRHLEQIHPQAHDGGLRMEDIPLYKSKHHSLSRERSAEAHHNTSRSLDGLRESSSSTPASRPPKAQNTANHQLEAFQMICPICSMTNEPPSLLCIACSHVLDTGKVTRYWRCQSDACKDSQYINAADCGLCGVCGARNSQSAP